MKNARKVIWIIESNSGRNICHTLMRKKQMIFGGFNAHLIYVEVNVNTCSFLKMRLIYDSLQ